MFRICKSQFICIIYHKNALGPLPADRLQNSASLNGLALKIF